MNKCFITQWLLVLYLSLLVGCTKDVTSPEKVGEPISLGLTLDTYAGEDSNAKEHEKAIHNLYVFIMVLTDGWRTRTIHGCSLRQTVR